ncbi:hypothetical protein ACU4GD_19555 [Cupriavidus basilensis]
MTIATPGPTVLLALNNGSRHGRTQGVLGHGRGAGRRCHPGRHRGRRAWRRDRRVRGCLRGDQVVWRRLPGVCGVEDAALRQGGADGTGDDAPKTDTGLRCHPHAGCGARAASCSPRSFLVALTNPKALLFISAFLPQFIDTSRGAAAAVRHPDAGPMPAEPGPSCWCTRRAGRAHRARLSWRQHALAEPAVGRHADCAGRRAGVLPPRASLKHAAPLPHYRALSGQRGPIHQCRSPRS